MTTEATTPADKKPDADPTGGGQQPPVVTAPATPQPTPSVEPPPTPAPPGVTPEEHAAALAKARQEEKSKLYPEIERLKAEKAASDKKLADAEKKAAERQQELEDVRAGKVTETESVNRELKELREQNQNLQSAIEEVATSAADRVVQSELKAYKEKKIREAGITQLSELVSGTSEEEIDAAVEKAKKKEEAIFEKAREEERAKLAHDLPTPIAPDGSQGRGPGGRVTPGKRTEVAQLKGDEYKKVRDQLLLEAKQKAGLA